MLDVFLTNELDLVRSLALETPFSMSDHSVIKFHLPGGSPSPPPPRLNFWAANFSKTEQVLASVVLDDLLGPSLTPDEMYRRLLDVLASFFATHFSCFCFGPSKPPRCLRFGKWLMSRPCSKLRARKRPLTIIIPLV